MITICVGRRKSPQNICFRLASFSSGKFNLCAGNFSCVEEIWKSYKGIIFESINHDVTQNFLIKNPVPDYYN